MTRPYHRWTEEEHTILLASAGLPLRTVQRRLGRPISIDMMKRRYYELTGHSITATVEARGMTLPAVATALDTTYRTVCRWRELETDDRLLAFSTYTGELERYLVKSVDLIAWIKRGTLAKWNFLLGGAWKPAPSWIGFVAEAEQTWCATHISSVELRALFAIAKHMPRGFPPADIRLTGNQRPHWWKREEVKKWVAANPRYLTAKVRAEL